MNSNIIETLSNFDSPYSKIEAIVTIVNSMTSGFIFLSNSSEAISADEILHLLLYLILISSAVNLISELRYIQVFHYFSPEEKFGKDAFCLENFRIAIEYLSKIDIDGESSDDIEFEIQFEET